MQEFGKGFDGTLKKAIESTSKLNEFPELIQKFMLFGDYKSGLIKKIDGTSLGSDKTGKDIQNYAAQIANLDNAQQNAIFSVTQFGDKSEEVIRKLIKDVQEYKRINSKTFESTLKSWDGGEIMTGDINTLMKVLGMKDGDSYALPEVSQVAKDLNEWAAAAENANAKERLLNAGILETTDNGVAFSHAFQQLAGIEKVATVVKEVLTKKQLALNFAMQIGKQLLLSIGVGIASFIASKIVDYISNLQTWSE